MRPEGSADGAAADEHVPEIALGVGAHLDRVAGGIKVAVLHQHPAERTLPRAFEAQSVVPAAHPAAADQHVPAAVDVEAVVVVIGVVAYGDVLDEQAVAVQIILHPAGGVFQGQPAQLHVPAVDDPDQEGPPRRSLRGFRAGKMIGRALPVDHAFSDEADVVAAFGKNQGLVHAHAGILDRQAGCMVLRIILQVRASKQPCPGADLQLHVGTKHERAADIVAVCKPHGAARLRRPVDGALDRFGRGFSRNEAEILGSKETFGWFSGNKLFLQRFRHQMKMQLQFVAPGG